MTRGPPEQPPCPAEWLGSLQGPAPWRPVSRVVQGRVPAETMSLYVGLRMLTATPRPVDLPETDPDLGVTGIDPARNLPDSANRHRPELAERGSAWG